MWSVLWNLEADRLPSALLAAIPALGNVVIGGYAVRRLPREPLTSVFVGLVAALLVWQGYDVMVRLAATPETSAAWRGLLRWGQHLVPAMAVHFALLYRGHRLAESPWVLFPLYGSAWLWTMAYPAGLTREELALHPTWGYIATAEMFGLRGLELASSGGLALLAAVVIWAEASRPSLDERRAAATRWLAFGIGVPVLGGVLFEALPPVLGVQQIPITSTWMSAFTVSAAIALSRHQLFRVSTLSAARAVLETMTDALLIVRDGGEVLFANPAARQRFGERVHPHRPVEGLFVDPGAAAAFRDQGLRPAVRGQSVAELELTLVGVRGEAPWLASVVPIGISRSGPLGAVLVLHDVSALKEALRALEVARDRAEASDRSKSLFLATMSHELRTPLNAIIGYSELLSELSDDPETSVDLRRIRQAGRHLLELIDDILDLSKVESGRIELRVERFPAREVVNQVAPLAAMMCEANGNRWELRGDDRLVLSSDRSRTRQVLLNLVSNAAKFTQQGTVTMTVTADAGWVRFDVTDTGIGMSDDQVSRLFGLFTQVHTGNRERYGGTGLGLALSRRLCLAMGGDLAVSSELGRGTTFVVRLPAG